MAKETKTKLQAFRLSPTDGVCLSALAAYHEMSKSDLMRMLIQKAFRDAGLSFVTPEDLESKRAEIDALQSEAETKQNELESLSNQMQTQLQDSDV